MARNLEMAVGLHKGHKTTKTVQKPKPSRRKGVRGLQFLSFRINNVQVLARIWCRSTVVQHYRQFVAVTVQAQESIFFLHVFLVIAYDVSLFDCVITM